MSDLSDPFSVIPDSFKGSQIAAVKYVASGGSEAAALDVVPGVAGVDGHGLEDAGIAVAIDHALGATVADELGYVEVVNAAHGLVPGVAAIEIQIPIEVCLLYTSPSPRDRQKYRMPSSA